jgi:tripartite-type tricarboxylate transporter receptor subunit TctC
VAKLNAEINAVMKDPEVLQRLKTIGFDPISKPPAETADFFKSEVASWSKMVNAIGITVD